MTTITEQGAAVGEGSRVLLGPLDWRELAACAGKDPDWWFPKGGGCHIYQHAKPICDACPVRQECLDEAMEFEGVYSQDWRFGMVGGLMPSERNALADKARTCRSCGTRYHSVRGSKVCSKPECKLWLRAQHVERQALARRA